MIEHIDSGYLFEQIDRAYELGVKEGELSVRSTLLDCKNELCYRCGNYKEEHLGKCDGCRWKDI